MLKFRFIFVILSILLSINAFAQNLIDECITYFNAGDYQRAINTCEKAVKLYPQNPDAYFWLGLTYRVTGQLDLALSNFKKSELYAKAKGDLGYIYNQIGLVYSKKGDYDNALYYYNKALNIFIDLNDRDMIASLYNNIAAVYDKQGDKDKALEYYQKSLELESDEKDKATTYNNIAVIYVSKGDYNKAIEYFKKAIEIDERYGQYHDLAIDMLNLGDTYRRAKDYDNAIYYLEEGLKRIQKVGDKYWEAFAYKYLGWYYQDINNKKLAKEYLLKAYNLYKSIGAEAGADDALYSLNELEQKKVSKYGGVEIGSKGVKAYAAEITIDDEGFYDLKEILRESINTTIISGVKETGNFAPDSIEETAKAVKTLYEKIKASGIPEENIFFVGSSALINVKNKDELAKRVKELTGKDLYFINVEQEVLFNIAGAVPPKYLYNSVVVDIGSGNTKIGYLEKIGDDINVKSFEIPYGTVSLTEEAKKRGDFRTYLREILSKEVSPMMARQIEKYPALKNRKNIFLIGGTVWALTTLQKPEKIDKNFVEISEADINRFLDTLYKNPEKAFNPDLSKLTEDKKQKVQKQVDKIKDVFTADNLISGTELLRTVLKNMDTKNKKLIFPRNGNWLIGYVVIRGYITEKNQ